MVIDASDMSYDRPYMNWLATHGKIKLRNGLNTGRITPFMSWSNRSYRLGGPLDPENTSLDPTTIAAINSESSYVVNLYRQATGQPPLSPQASAPSVNIGVTPETGGLIVAGLLGALFLLRKR